MMGKNRIAPETEKLESPNSNCALKHQANLEMV